MTHQQALLRRAFKSNRAGGQCTADFSRGCVSNSRRSEATKSSDRTELIDYDAPTGPAPPGIQVEQGWWAVYSGLFEGLRVQLKEIRGNKLIRSDGTDRL